MNLINRLRQARKKLFFNGYQPLKTIAALLIVMTVVFVGAAYLLIQLFTLIFTHWI